MRPDLHSIFYHAQKNDLMNKTALIIIGSVVAGFALLALYDHYRNDSGFGFSFAGKKVGNDTPSAQPVPKVYTRLNYETQLNPGVKGQEVEVLQRFINAYNGNYDLAVSGIFDDATETRLRAIAGKAGTNLLEFRNNYLNVKYQSDIIAQEIVGGKRA